MMFGQRLLWLVKIARIVITYHARIVEMIQIVLKSKSIAQSATSTPCIKKLANYFFIPVIKVSLWV